MGKLSALALFLSAAIVPILGITPNLTMDKIADIAGGFLNAATPAHAVHYFSLTNIKGACISLVIGLVVYLAFIRPVLTKKEAGVRQYVDLWPSWLDIEDRVYRPAIYGLLDIGGRFAGLGSEITLETYVYRPLIPRADAVLCGGVWFPRRPDGLCGRPACPQGALRPKEEARKQRRATRLPALSAAYSTAWPRG